MACENEMERKPSGAPKCGIPGLSATAGVEMPLPPPLISFNWRFFPFFCLTFCRLLDIFVLFFFLAMMTSYPNAIVNS